MTEEIAEVNRIRLDDDLSVAQLAADIGIETSTLHRLLFKPGRKPFDRTVHKINRFLADRRAAAKANATRRKRVS